VRDNTLGVVVTKCHTVTTFSPLWLLNGEKYQKQEEKTKK
jgi:hypothetical protein